MKLFFLVNVSAALAHFGLGLLYFNLQRRDGFRRSSILLCVNLGCMNLLFALMTSAQTLDGAWVYFHLGRHFLFLNAPLFLWMALELSGRMKTRPLRVLLGATFIYALLFMVLIQVTYFTSSSILIAELRLYSWGYFPMSAMGARLLLGVLYSVCISVGLYSLWKPAKNFASPPYQTKSTRVPAILYTFWWAGLFLNVLTFIGLPLLPLGNVADALIAMAIAVWLHRGRVIHASGRSMLFSSALSSISFGLFVTWICLEVLAIQSAQLRSLIGLVTAGAAFLAYHLWFTSARSVPVKSTGHGALGVSMTDRLRNDWNLTSQEARICTLLAEGLAKKRIVALLDISEGTFRNHMSSIYDKTIANSKDAQSGTGRDKLQRLTVFLHNIERNMT